MDNEQSGATASTSNSKNTEKKDIHFFRKTAQSIRNKLHGFSGDVKEKTLNLTHSINLKPKKKDKDHKTKDSENELPPQSPTTRKKSLPTESSDEDNSKKPSASHVTTARHMDTPKTPSSSSEPSKNDADISTRSETPNNHATVYNSVKRSSSDLKDTAAPSARSSDDHSSAEPANYKSNNQSKPTRTMSNKNENVIGKVLKSSTKTRNSDRIHISFDGTLTVDEVLYRIDKAIEKANIVIEDGKGKISVNIEKSPNFSKPQFHSMDKSVQEVEDNKYQGKQKEKIQKTKINGNNEDGDKNQTKIVDEEEPIILDYNEIHSIEDILLKIQDKPGHRKVMLQNEPTNDIDSFFVQKISEQSSNASAILTQSDKNVNSSISSKAILKTSEAPSSSELSTKAPSCQNDQIHLDIENVHSVGDLLDRVDDAVQHAPVLIDPKSRKKKRRAPLAGNKTANYDELQRKAATFTNRKGKAVSGSNQSKSSDISTETSEEETDDDEEANNHSLNEKSSKLNLEIKRDKEDKSWL